MKLFKSLLLASATGMVAVSGASAADLGAKKPSPVEYVRACYNPLWGTSGGFIIPGTQTCLRVGGQARFDIGYSEPFARNSQVLGYRGGGSIFLDAITPSEYGNVRAFVNMSMLYRTGTQRTGTGARWGQTIDAGSTSPFGSAAGTDFSGSSGFIQFAGFTFGRTASFFNTVGIAPSIISPQIGAGAGNVNQVAYTAVLGNGFLATIALEDPTTRRNGIGALNNTNPALVTNASAVNYSGNRMPNLVAALRLDQAWGSAEISGIVSEIRSGDRTTGFPVGATFVPGVAGSFNTTNGLFTAPVLSNGVGYASTKYGFSIAGGLKINLPMIAAGDALYLNAVYTDGIINSVVGNYFGGSSSTITSTGGATLGAFDAVIDPFSGSLKTTKAWGVNAGFQHFWAPTFATTITGSYGEVDHAAISSGIGDYKIWMAGLLNTWSPVRGLTFGVDLAYINVDPKGRIADGNKGGTFTLSRESQFLARFRVTRDF
jgi:hypothetical protein